MGRPRIPVNERFWDKVNKTDSCWLWTSKLNGSGYGVIAVPDDTRGNSSCGTRVKRRYFLAHRMAWELTHGSIPEDKILCHHCDNPICVRPDHLFLGSHADNIRDKVSKNRQAMGTKNSQAKLTEEKVKEIRAIGYKLMEKEVAQMFKVSPATIGEIRRREIWKQVK